MQDDVVNIIRVRQLDSVVLLIFMSDIFLYMFNKGYFTFINHHFVLITSKTTKNSYYTEGEYSKLELSLPFLHGF